jgi:hypothetical protein
MESSTRSTESLDMLPAEYWESDPFSYGALVDSLSVNHLLMQTARDMPVGSKLNVRIFYANECELEEVKVAANITAKRLQTAEVGKGYQYGLTVFHISEEDRQKIKSLLKGDLNSEHISGEEGVAPANPSFERASLSPLPSSELSTASTAKCKFYENGKCLRTHAFCDLCNNADEVKLVQGQNRSVMSKAHNSSPFASIMSKLADSFRSSFQEH